MKRLLLLLFIIIAFANSYSANAIVLNNDALFTGLIISWQRKETTDDTLWIRVREVKTNEFTKWYQIKADADTDENDFVTIESSLEEAWLSEETLFSTNLSREVEYKIERRDNLSGIRNVKIEKIFLNRPGVSSLLASLDIPKKNAIISRSQWGVDEEITIEQNDSENVGRANGEAVNDAAEQSDIAFDDPEIEKVIESNEKNEKYIWPLQYAKKIRFIVIHHTASVSNLDNPKTAIQNIQYYHAVKRGWGDIGYNYIIDTNGRVYEGRKGGEKVIGGHAKPLNKVSIGIAVLGNYEENEVPAAVLRSLMGLLREKAALYKIPIQGRTLYKGILYNNIQGHFENTATACPGQFLKEKLDGFKELILYQKRKEPVANPEIYDFRDLERRSIIITLPDQEKEFRIRLKNSGTVAWEKNTFLETVSDVAGVPKVFAKLSNERVEPEGLGVFHGTLPASLVSGMRIPNVALVINGSIRPKKKIPVPIMVEGLKATYELIGRSDTPRIIKAGSRIKAWVKLKNTGNFTWKRDGDNAVRIGTLRPQDRSGIFFKGKNRIAKLREKEIKPGEVGTFNFYITAPRSAGTHSEYFAPVVEDAAWMQDTGMHFRLTVESDEKPLRVALRFTKKKAKIRSSEKMQLYEKKSLVAQFGKDELVTVNLLEDGRFLVEGKDKRTIMASPPRFHAHYNGILELANFKNQPAWNKKLNDNLYRGIIEINSVNGKLKVINELALEDYLKGIAEVSNGDPREKIKTIIILARSYAKYYRDIGRKFPGKPYDLDDDPDHTQKYLGYGFELRAPDITSAAAETLGQIVTYQGKPVITPYFNQSDGKTRSAKEMWGWDSTPYLESVPDIFCGSTELKGHGVGVSGCGATALAKQGKTAEEIIKYYYKGVEIENPKS